MSMVDVLDASLLDRLADLYGDGWRLLQDGTDTAVTAAWYELGGLRDADMVRWDEAVEDIIVAAQEQAAAGAAAWMDTQVGMMGAAGLPAAQPVLLESPAMLGSSPVVRMRTLVAGGMEYTAALADAAGTVRRVASSMLRTAEIVGRAERAEQVARYIPPGRRVSPVSGRLVRDTRLALYYARVPGPRACPWCVAVATRLYSEEGVAGAWHSHCDCTWRLAQPEDMDRIGTLDGGAWRDSPLADTSARRQRARAARLEETRQRYQERGDYWKQQARVTPDQEAETRYQKRAEAWWAKAKALR